MVVLKCTRTFAPFYSIIFVAVDIRWAPNDFIWLPLCLPPDSWEMRSVPEPAHGMCAELGRAMRLRSASALGFESEGLLYVFPSWFTLADWGVSASADLSVADSLHSSGFLCLSVVSARVFNAAFRATITVFAS